MELVPRYLNFARTYFPDIFFQRPLILFFLKYDNNFLLENDTKYRHTKRKTCRQMLYLRSLL